MRYLIGGLMLATAGLASVPASAATVVYEGKCQQFCYLPKVNGTVNSVSYFFDYNGYQSFGWRGTSAEGAGVYQASGTLFVSGGRSVNYSIPVTANGDGVDATFYLRFPISQELTGNLSYYEGEGDFEIGAFTFPTYTYISGRGVDFGNQTGGRPFDSDYRITIDYEAAPFVPEPSTWALMLAGFGMVGYAMRRRKVGFTAAA